MRQFILGVVLISSGAAQILVQSAANPQIQNTIVPGSLINISLTPSNGPVPVLDPTVVSLQIDGELSQIVNIRGVTVEAIVPADTPLGPGTVVLKTALNITAPVVYVNVVASDFALFTNSGGAGQATAQNVSLGQIGPNNLTHPAHPGDYVALYGTGLGSATQSQVAVLLGGHPAQVTFAGHTAALPGTDLINFQVPTDVAIPNGCFVAVQVVVNGVPTNQASISTAAVGAAACTPPIDLTTAQMSQLDAGQSIPLVSFLIDGLVSTPPGLSGLVRNESFNAEAIVTNEASLAVMSQSLVAEDVFYGCAATSAAPAAVVGVFGGNGIDLGPKLTLTGPGTTGYILTSPGVPFYSLSLPTGPAVSSPEQLPPPYFVSGVWQISSPGTQPNPYFEALYPTLPFSAQITSPPTLQITNFASLQTISIAKDVVVTWNPSGYGPGDVVTVTLGPVGATCRAHASDGQLSIPSSLLQATPTAVANPIWSGAPYLQVSVTPRPDQIVRADVPLSTGAYIPGRFTYSFTESFPIAIQ